MEKYYFVAAAFPAIKIGTTPEMSFHELQLMLEINLNNEDQKKNKIFKNYIDILNLRQLWLNRELDFRGNLNEKEIEDALLIKDVLPDFVFEFLERYENKEDRLKNFAYLLASFFKIVTSEYKGFLFDYFKFEREYRLILTAFRSKIYKKDIVKELQFEDQFDDLVAYILSQKDMDKFDPTDEYEDLGLIFMNNFLDPKRLHFLLLEYRFKKIEEMMEKKPFTIDQILGYMALLRIVEDFDRLDLEKGKSIVKSFI